MAKSKKPVKRVKHKILKLYDETFGANIYLSIGCKFSVYKDQVRREFKDQPDIVEGLSSQTDEFGRASTFTYKDGRRVYWLWCVKKHTPYIVHEAVHIVYLSLAEVGVKLCDDSDEVYAYMVQRIVEQALLVKLR